MLLADILVLVLLYAGVQYLEAMPEGTLGRSASESARVAAYVIGGLVALAALGLWAVQPFGRALQRLVALLWLPVVPVGTVLGLFMWVYLGRPGVRLVFSGGRPLSVPELKQVTGSRKLAPVAAILLLVLHGFALLAVIGAAAGAEPLLLQARTLRQTVDGLLGTTTQPEPDGMGTVVEELLIFGAAQIEYARVNGGLYDRTECLVADANCIPGNPPRTAALDRRFLQVERGGYEFILRLGPPPQDREETTSPTGVTGFAYLARPVRESAGTVGYCIDASQGVCLFGAGEELPVERGLCTPACVPMEPTGETPTVPSVTGSQTRREGTDPD
jgi:hypothetical protein